MLEVRRGRTLFALAHELDRLGVPGAIVDCGVWNGGSSLLMSRGAPSRSVWVFDSFEGMPAPTEADGAGASEWIGVARGSVERVREAFDRYGTGAPLHIVEGWFEETLARSAPSIGPIALLHIDADWYESMRVALETLYPLVVAGGCIAIDDYGHAGFPGVKRAVDGFRGQAGDRGQMIDNHFWRKSPSDRTE
jgi:O-methyltransferase